MRGSALSVRVRKSVRVVKPRLAALKLYMPRLSVVELARIRDVERLGYEPESHALGAERNVTPPEARTHRHRVNKLRLRDDCGRRPSCDERAGLDRRSGKLTPSAAERRAATMITQ